METYSYVKERRRFGRQCLFSEINKVLETVMPDRSEARNFILRDPVHNTTQLSKQFALSEMNTVNPEYVPHGVNHCEGGWPKDVNMLDEEQTLRHRKKIERDDQYPVQLNNILRPMLHAVNQNNAVQLYENYFADIEPLPPNEKPSARTVQCFRYPSEREKAPACHVCFSPEGGTEMAVAYARLGYQAVQLEDTSSYIWSLENPQVPHLRLQCDAACTTVEYNLREGRLLAGGLDNGKVCVWDTRVGSEPTLITEKEYTHRKRVTSLLWMHSKSNSEFYSGSADGQLYFWDIRKFTAPIDALTCDPVRGEQQDLFRSYGVSVLEFEYTIPTKYLVGTDEGYVYFGNRKGSTISEKLPAHMLCSSGPIRALERNPMFVKNFMTVGGYRVKLFSEECKDNPVMWTRNQDHELNCGCWSRTRCSLMLIGRQDGTLDCWDMLTDLRHPLVSLKVSTQPMVHNRAHENGMWVACGDENGDTYMVELSAALAFSSKSDKVLLSAMFERESKREKILEARLREIKLKEKTQMEELEKQLAKEREQKTSGVGEEAAKSSAELLDASQRVQVYAEYIEAVRGEEKKRDKHNKYQKEKEEVAPLATDAAAAESAPAADLEATQLADATAAQETAPADDPPPSEEQQ